MAQHTNRERFLRIQTRALLASLFDGEELSAADEDLFRQLFRLLSAIFHFEYQQRLEALKDAYEPFDPDLDKDSRPALDQDKQAQALDDLFAGFTQLMERANYQRLTRDEIQDAVRQGASDWGLNMEVDFDAFDRLDVFACGDTLGKRYRRRLMNWGRLEEVSVPIYQRLVLILKMKARARLDPAVDTENVYLKLFKDIPKIDLEMLLPGTRLRMPVLERLKLGGSLLSSVGFVFWKIAAETQHLLSAVLQHRPLVFWGPISLMLGYGYRQYQGFQTTKQTYSLMLTQSLYYQNLDNNVGVMTRLLDVAEAQECREAILAYYILLRRAGTHGYTRDEIDAAVEQILERKAKVQVDFEIDDALAKLERLALVQQTCDRYTAIPLRSALERLDEIWDNYFRYHNERECRRAG